MPNQLKTFEAARRLVVTEERASISFLQRSLQIGYNLAAILLEELEAKGVVSVPDASGKRKILMDRSALAAAEDSEGLDPADPPTMVAEGAETPAGAEGSEDEFDVDPDWGTTDHAQAFMGSSE